MYRRCVHRVRRTAELYGPHADERGGCWCGNAHIGRWWRRRLHKAERRAVRDRHCRGLTHFRSTVDWKGS